MTADYISSVEFHNTLQSFIQTALAEDIGNGDHTTLATIEKDKQGTARLIVKDRGHIAGISIAGSIFGYYDKNLIFNPLLKDGEEVKNGDIAFIVSGSIRSILSTERVVLNVMQRLSGITTKTRQMSELIKEYPAKLLDTRKTTPGMRLLEKWAVSLGGGVNHRIGLFDMILIKDNHIDAAGGITAAVSRTRNYLIQHNLNLDIEVEARNLDDVREILALKGIKRILLDNFDISELKKAVELIDKRVETEASGKITEDNIEKYAATGVDYISSGALTHSVKPLDLSLKLVK